MFQWSVNMKAYEVFEKRGLKWIQRNMAEDALGCSTYISDPEVRSVCMLGAIRMAYRGSKEKMCAVEGIVRRRIGGSITQWNDDRLRTFDEVVKVLKELDV
jgi:hypothetical protein